MAQCCQQTTEKVQNPFRKYDFFFRKNIAELPRNFTAYSKVILLNFQFGCEEWRGQWPHEERTRSCRSGPLRWRTTVRSIHIFSNKNLYKYAISFIYIADQASKRYKVGASRSTSSCGVQVSIFIISLQLIYESLVSAISLKLSTRFCIVCEFAPLRLYRNCAISQLFLDLRCFRFSGSKGLS